MSHDILLALVTFAFVTTATPGPNNLMLMASGTNYGFMRTIPHILGVSGGVAIMLLVVGAGLMQVFDAFPVSYVILKTASVLYLLYLAWKIATAAPPDMDTTDAGTASRPFTFLQAAAFQWVNPKAWAMSLTAISAYTLPAHPIASLLVIALVFILVSLPAISGWTLLGTQLRRLLGDPLRLRIFNITAALILVASLWPIVTMPLGG